MDWAAARDAIIAEARGRGWAAAGVAGVRPFRQARARALDAIEAGRMSGMDWLSAERIESATDLRRRHPWARSILSLAWPYRPAVAAGSSPGREPGAGRPVGRIAAYACLEAPETGRPADYHDLMAREVDLLSGWIATRHPGAQSKRFIDHGWAMDRPIAERAGIGFAGKNTTLLTRTAGSYVLLADVLLSLPLPATRPSRRSCGGCAACLPSCPTGALVAPGVMDARRCISYLTIEHRGSIPEALRPVMGTWIFGCDLCQEACPINARLAPPALERDAPSTAEGPVPFPDLIECLELDEVGFSRRFRGTAIQRTGRAGLARNAAIALGNAGDRGAVPALRRASDADPDPVVRESARWALARLGSPA